MACRLCERSVRIPQGSGSVYLFAPVTEIVLKLTELLRGWPEAFIAEDGALVGQTLEFESFLTRLLGAASWSSVEKNGVTLLFLPQGRSLNFAAFQETRSLEEWIKVTQSAFLARIIDNKSLVTHFHPIWNMDTEELYGWECLTRGVDEEGALVPPSRLFSVAGESGMMFPLDRLARQTALRHAQAAGLPGKLFINFVPTAIYDPVFCLKTTVDLAKTLGLDPERVVFEVVESEKVEDESHLKSIVDYYRNQGFQVALDDVGSGYSSLNTLVALRPDVLKVDLKIIRGIDHEPANQAVFRALVSIAREMGTILLAEGIETAAERDWVHAEGAHLAQGFLWGPPHARPPLDGLYR